MCLGYDIFKKVDIQIVGNTWHLTRGSYKPLSILKHDPLHVPSGLLPPRPQVNRTDYCAEGDI